MTKRKVKKKKDDRAFHKTFLHYFEYTLWLITGGSFISSIVLVSMGYMPLAEYMMLIAILVSEFID